MIEKAVKFAIKAHEGQFRKGSTIPDIIAYDGGYGCKDCGSIT